MFVRIFSEYSATFNCCWTGWGLRWLCARGVTAVLSCVYSRIAAPGNCMIYSFQPNATKIVLLFIKDVSQLG